MHDPKLRASDADRERVADLLRRHCGDGRLTMEEFHTRLDACFEAKTLGDLDALTADLPGPGPYDDLPVPASQQAGHSPALPHAAPPARLHPALASYVTVNLVCWVVWLVGGASGYPWPVWVSGPWGAVLLARAITGNLPRHPPDRR